MKPVQSLFASTATASQRPVLAFLKDLQVSILLKPSASTPDGPPEPLVFKPASLTFGVDGLVAKSGQQW